MLYEELLQNHNLTSDEVKIMHFGDFVKFVASQYGGWDGQKDEAGRTMLQVIGTERGRYTVDPDIWVNMVKYAIGIFADELKYVIIPDTRFPNEILSFVATTIGGSAIQVCPARIIRPNFDNGLTEEQKNHPSETALDSTTFLHTYSCTNLDELSQAAKEFVAMLVEDFDN